MDNQQDREPDRVHTCSLSRRHALALGVGAISALAGCNGLVGPETPPPPPSVAETETPSLSDKIEASAEFTIDEVTLEVDIGSYAEDSLSGTLRLYSAPNLDRSNKTVVGEQSIDQTDTTATYTFEPDYDLGYGQHFQFTIEDSEEGERPIHTPKETIVPFYNAARDEHMVKVEAPRLPGDSYTNEDAYWGTQIWFDSPDDLFDTPEVPEDRYDPDWYEYRNIQMTALVCYPNYEEIHEIGQDIGGDTVYAPYFDYFAVNMSLGEWELLEAFRWNSVGTQKLEVQQRDYGTDTGEVGDPTDYGSVMAWRSSDIEVDAASQPSFFEQYQDSLVDGDSYSQVMTNPLLVAGSRPFCKRAADAMSEALDNPSFNSIDSTEYHKAAALQVFVGSSPYSFGTSPYSATPEESINRWYLASEGERDGAGNCQDGSHLYSGIAVHLLDSGTAAIEMEAPGAHITSGVINLSTPEKPLEYWSDNHPSKFGGEAYTLETEYGEVSIVECTDPAPFIGWNLESGKNIRLQTYLMNTSVESHVPLNDKYEPSESGSIRSSQSDPLSTLNYHREYITIADIDTR